MSLEEVLRILISKKFKTIKGLASNVDMPQSTINMALRRGITGSSAENIYKICMALEIDFYALMQGEIKDYIKDAVRLTKQENDLLLKVRALDSFGINAVKSIINNEYERNVFYGNATEFVYKDFYQLPVSAGNGIYLDDSYKEAIRIHKTPVSERADFVLRVAGDSMEPRFQDSDIVLIKSQPIINQGEIGIFILNNEAYIKELGYNELISKNPEYDPILISEEDSLICKGKVLGKTKEVL